MDYIKLDVICAAATRSVASIIAGIKVPVLSGKRVVRSLYARQSMMIEDRLDACIFQHLQSLLLYHRVATL